MGNHNSLSKSEYIEDIGDGKRKERCTNIATAMISAWDKMPEEDKNGGQKYIVKKHLRDHILEKTNQTPNDIVGDYRAHGDACGGHGLKLDMEGSGSEGTIKFTKKNIKKCIEFLITRNDDDEITLT